MVKQILNSIILYLIIQFFTVVIYLSTFVHFGSDMFWSFAPFRTIAVILLYIIICSLTRNRFSLMRNVVAVATITLILLILSVVINISFSGTSIIYYVNFSSIIIKNTSLAFADLNEDIFVYLMCFLPAILMLSGTYIGKLARYVKKLNLHASPSNH